VEVRIGMWEGILYAESGAMIGGRWRGLHCKFVFGVWAVMTGQLRINIQ
jgi:hypothetical protein